MIESTVDIIDAILRLTYDEHEFIKKRYTNCDNENEVNHWCAEWRKKIDPELKKLDVILKLNGEREKLIKDLSLNGIAGGFIATTIEELKEIDEQINLKLEILGCRI